MIRTKRFNRLKQPWSDVERVLYWYWTVGWSIGPGGNGDLLYNTARAIIEGDCTDRSAHYSIVEIFKCLSEGKRWPDDMSQYITTTNHKQTDITKDPWIMAYCCAVYLGRKDLIWKYGPPYTKVGDKWKRWSYFNWIERQWYISLCGGNSHYWWLRLLPFHIFLPKHTYVLYGFMDQAYLKVKTKH